MATRLDGRLLAQEIEQRLADVIAERLERAGRPPGLAVLRVGDDPASGVYVANKEKACGRVGIRSFLTHLAAGTPAAEVLAAIRQLNADSCVDGILLQLPLPADMSEGPLLAAIDPEKDADGLHTLNLGRLLKGEPGPRSCTPAGVMALLARSQVELRGKRAVVVGRSILVGQPMALMLQAADATVSVAHSRTSDLAALTRQADVLVVAAGRPRMIGAEHVKPGAVVVDVGIHRLDPDPSAGPQARSKLCGDVRFEEVEPIASAITPVPGGVGPMTVTLLLVNTVTSWCQRCGLDQPLADLLP
ncbi:bifunctional methylenetetrahydrofolate dehydrogenase/methenyltetrahydrofolate cyclohydrolase FolD [Synechococcus sp. CCY9201]|uniref:bifunctional methylenetetrahydrofolate dehydrogenase/methenyltetrahydrofolate cyclohydrolase FolD n=1 Tax=unclassified Synechococcus TaxID=2626047 RepID=UPI0018CD6E8F|nr:MULTISPECIES: bifunctional methylenetetrahydrofolate dehydrogenase/methenyltetrahydrofolate cyclohydrolase FolD [unclassified Synechococcus]MEA5422317.1 bifunctional methylenetetrahydrofolate dehydrogenase/methenyltetrahydrofolate cyclohydrolase FolD [Synechococcus sp. CCY9202]MEA5475338.1 bifunctional methylenetetrahydrofolate dehydrogenase/methenyltetrahydrofolate cyclohydrolase FolD [Synechococcus sp. CCY9201]QPN58744.1 bifunctional methylenetetrahydrofolate dehydrogenase/methenyltetrahydr